MAVGIVQKVGMVILEEATVRPLPVVVEVTPEERTVLILPIPGEVAAAGIPNGSDILPQPSRSVVTVEVAAMVILP